MRQKEAISPCMMSSQKSCCITCVYHILSVEAVEGLPRFGGGGGGKTPRPDGEQQIWKEHVEPEILQWPFLEKTVGHRLYLPKLKTSLKLQRLPLKTSVTLSVQKAGWVRPVILKLIYRNFYPINLFSETQDIEQVAMKLLPWNKAGTKPQERAFSLHTRALSSLPAGTVSALTLYTLQVEPRSWEGWSVLRGSPTYA